MALFKSMEKTATTAGTIIPGMIVPIRLDRPKLGAYFNRRGNVKAQRSGDCFANFDLSGLRSWRAARSGRPTGKGDLSSLRRGMVSSGNNRVE
jgi:hypothetical protein